MLIPKLQIKLAIQLKWGPIFFNHNMGNIEAPWNIMPNEHAQ